MVDRGDGPRLTFEALAETGCELGLDGDAPIEAGVSRLPHLTHAASAEGGKNLLYRTEPRSGRRSHGEVLRIME